MSGTPNQTSASKKRAFKGEAKCAGRVFKKTVKFSNWIFPAGADFTGATFEQGADFAGATFEQALNFGETTFEQHAHFEGATFHEYADFERATFRNYAGFGLATFCDYAYFERATFDGPADFGGAKFASTPSFVNADMKSRTSFICAVFQDQPPDFAGAKLHEGTAWFGVKWPPAPKSIAEARGAVSAYERLKLEMDRLKKHADELDFFALELQARRVLAGKWTSLTGWASWLYGLLSDYGRSVRRPLAGLGVVIGLGAPAFWAHDAWPAWRDWPAWRAALGLSAANTLGVFNFRQAFFAADEIAKLPGWLQVLSAGETILGALLLFLLGLGLRNTFRLR